MTYLWTSEGWVYLAVFLDLYSRTVVGWATGQRIDSALVVTALTRALLRRHPKPGLVVHTDQGSQYASQVFAAALAASGARQSMSRRGNCWDNAVAESFFHSLKVEAMYGNRFESRRKMEYEVFDYIERFYNQVRRHSAIGFVSPAWYEKQHWKTAA
jgi:transposase InsO family protein